VSDFRDRSVGPLKGIDNPHYKTHQSVHSITELSKPKLIRILGRKKADRIIKHQYVKCPEAAVFTLIVSCNCVKEEAVVVVVEVVVVVAIVVVQR
jgi:hypothetical protein